MLRKLLLTLSGLLFLISPATAEETWKAGAAKEVITPPKLMWMSGYASRDHAAWSATSSICSQLARRYRERAVCSRTSRGRGSRRSRFRWPKIQRSA